MPTKSDPANRDPAASAAPPTTFRDREAAAAHLTQAIRERIETVRRTLSRSHAKSHEDIAETDGAPGNGDGAIAALSRPLVIGIPRGGVETASVVARTLPADFDLIVSRKLGYPQNPELAFGAIAENGGRYMRPEKSSFLTREIIESVEEIEHKELRRRIRVYRQGRPPVPLRGRFVIVVDDGIATGCTLFATLQSVRNQKPARIMVAAPVAPPEMRSTLQSLVDDVVIPLTPHDFHAVSQIYEHFPGLSDKDVLRLVESTDKTPRLERTSQPG